LIAFIITILKQKQCQFVKENGKIHTYDTEIMLVVTRNFYFCFIFEKIEHGIRHLVKALDGGGEQIPLSVVMIRLLTPLFQ
jgi:hypothetical protein